MQNLTSVLAKFNAAFEAAEEHPEANGHPWMALEVAEKWLVSMREIRKGGEPTYAGLPAHDIGTLTRPEYKALRAYVREIVDIGS